jgi:hypothetical protein
MSLGQSLLGRFSGSLFLTVGGATAATAFAGAVTATLLAASVRAKALDLSDENDSVVSRIVDSVAPSELSRVFDEGQLTTQLWRVSVLEEVINLNRYKFSATDRRGSDGEEWQPGWFHRVLAGVPSSDIRALLSFRAERRQSL